MVEPPFGVPEEKNWSVLEQREIAANPWFRLLESRVRMPDRGCTTYHTLDFLRAAVGVVARREGEILLIRQYRFIVDAFVWAVPSGGVERTEDLAAAAARELYEESGYRADRIAPLLDYYPSYGCGNQEFHCFLAEGLRRGPVAFDSNEVLEVRWFSKAEVVSMILSGHIVDGLSLTPLLFLFARESAGGGPCT